MSDDRRAQVRAWLDKWEAEYDRISIPGHAFMALRALLDEHSPDNFGFCRGWPCSAVDEQETCPVIFKIHRALVGGSPR